MTVTATQGEHMIGAMTDAAEIGACMNGGNIGVRGRSADVGSVTKPVVVTGSTNTVAAITASVMAMTGTNPS
jgi:hypothetical protein